MASRRKVREIIVKLLYAMDLGNENSQEHFEEYLEEERIRGQYRDFGITLFKTVISNLQTIDSLIENKLKTKNFERVGRVERAILRMGVGEILFSDVDRAVIINESIEIVKKLGSNTSPKFINGVLDAVIKEIEERKKTQV